MKIYLAGRVAVEGNGVVVDERRFPGRQGRLLFAYLVVGQGRPIPRDELADVLWEDAPPATWEKALGVLASKLRSVLGESGTLTAAFGCYRLDLPEGSWVDVIAAEEAAGESEAALARSDVAAAKHAAALAETLIRGPFLPGDDRTWVEQKRRELSGVRARALNALAEACLRSGEAQESVRWAEQSIEAEPFRESGYRLLMQAHIAAGNRAEALRVYERCRQLLAEELGAFPSPETEALYRELLEAPTAPTPRSPRADVPVERRGASRRQKRATGLVLLLAAGVGAAVFAVESHSAPPKVVPDSVIGINPSTLRVTKVIRLPAVQPDLIVTAGGFVWVTTQILRDTGTDQPSSSGEHTLIRVDPKNGNTKPVSNGLAPCGLTADPSGKVWVSDCNPGAHGSSDSVVRVDPSTLRLSRQVPLPKAEGYYQALVYGDGSLWVGSINGLGPPVPTLTKVDPQKLPAASTLAQKFPAGAMAWADGYGDVWMTNFDAGTMTRYDVATGKSAIVRSGVANPGSVVVNGDTVWVGDWNSMTVSRLHAVGPPRPRRIVLTRHTPVASGVWDIAAGFGYIWVTAPRSRTIWRIDPTTNKVTPIHIPYLPAGVATDANNVWVTVRGP